MTRESIWDIAKDCFKTEAIQLPENTKLVVNKDFQLCFKAINPRKPFIARSFDLTIMDQLLQSKEFEMNKDVEIIRAELKNEVISRINSLEGRAEVQAAWIRGDRKRLDVLEMDKGMDLVKDSHLFKELQEQYKATNKRLDAVIDTNMFLREKLNVKTEEGTFTTPAVEPKEGDLLKFNGCKWECTAPKAVQPVPKVPMLPRVALGLALFSPVMAATPLLGVLARLFVSATLPSKAHLLPGFRDVVKGVARFCFRADMSWRHLLALVPSSTPWLAAMELSGFTNFVPWI